MYNKEKAGSRPVSWSMIFDPQQQIGKYVLMDSMRDMLGIALKYQGKSMNSRQAAEVRSAGDLVLAAKRSHNSLGFEGGVGGKNRVMAGEAAAAIVYNGDAIKAIAENPGAKVGFEVPGEGGIIWVDVMLIPSKAPNSEGAHRFINYILDPAVGAQLSNFNHYATPNAASMPQIKEEDRRNPGIYPGPEIMKKLEYLEDVGQDTKIYDEVWTSVKAK
jgi:spermidine/putrescine transport system substrate-binding protein